MSKFEALVEKFNSAQNQIKNLGSEMVEAYPNSPRVVELKEEISIAAEALDSLSATLSEALQAIEAEDELKRSLTQQMEESELYMSAFNPQERTELAEYLAAKKQPLADDDLLLQYVAKSLMQKSVSDLVAMYPKNKIVERGKTLDDGAEDFNAYQAGFDQIREDFDNDKGKAVGDLSKLWLDKGLEAVAREFYSTVFKPEEDMAGEE